MACLQQQTPVLALQEMMAACHKIFVAEHLSNALYLPQDERCPQRCLQSEDLVMMPACTALNTSAFTVGSCGTVTTQVEFSSRKLVWYSLDPSVRETEMLSALTSPAVLEGRVDLKGDVTMLPNYANAIGEPQGALRVNHVLKRVFPRGFLPLAMLVGMLRGVIDGFLFSSQKKKKVSLVLSCD